MTRISQRIDIMQQKYLFNTIRLLIVIENILLLTIHSAFKKLVTVVNWIHCSLLIRSLLLNLCSLNYQPLRGNWMIVRKLNSSCLTACFSNANSRARILSQDAYSIPLLFHIVGGLSNGSPTTREDELL